jgi:predicted ArsR family transcriptional regulator
MAKHDVLRFLKQDTLVHAKDVAEHWEITEPGARAILHHLRRRGLVRQVWVLTDHGKARLKHFDAEGCASPECALCRTEKQKDVLEWLFGR